MADNVIVRVPEQQFIRGEDGFDPVVTIEDIEHGHRVTITDREHPVEGQSFDVMDGASAYEQAVAGGYEGTEEEFNADLADFSEKEQATTNAAATAAQSAQNAADSATAATTKAQEAADSAATALTRMNSANSSAQAAANSASSAEAAKTAAQAAQNEAEYARSDAIAAANAAGGYSSQARQAIGQAQSAMNAAQRAADSATANAAAASNSATAAANSATAAGDAKAAAETAQGKAEDAQAAAEQAQSDAETAAQSVSQSAAQIGQNASDIRDLKSAINISTPVHLFNNESDFGRYTIGASGKAIEFEPSTTRIAYNRTFNIQNYQNVIHVKPDAGYKYVLYTLLNSTEFAPLYPEQAIWQTDERDITLPDGTAYVAFVIAKTDNSTILTSDYNKVTVTAITNTTVKSEIEKINEKLSDYSYLPLYWKTYFSDKETELMSADMSLGFDGVSFAFVTDIHVNTNNKISPLLLQYITTHTNVRHVVCGGDIVTNFSTKDVALSELNWWMQETSGLDIANLHGNHDGNSNNQTDNTQIISDAEFYGLCCRQSENFVVWEHNKLYGYRDNNNQKMRFIYLDTGAPDSAVINNAQIEWMKSKISELPAGWFVVVFCHQFWTGTNKTTPTLQLDGNGTAILNALESIYDNVDAVICCVIAGHCHRNYSLVSEKGFPVIATTCDTSGTGASTYDPDTPNRAIGATTEQAFDLFYVNTSARTINTIRIGAGDTAQNRSFTF